MASVLLIEDDPAIADLMRVILEDEGHTILHVEQVPADLDPFKSQALDLIISDLANEISMRDLWSPVHELRKAIPDVPILVCTAHSAGALGESEERGVAGILLKPFGYEELLGEVEAILTARTRRPG